MLRQAYVYEAMGRMQCFEGSGTPATSIIPRNVEKIHQFGHEDRRKAINDIADVVDLSYGFMQAILSSGFFATTMHPTKSNMISLPHPPYSPYFSPTDFYVFLKMKMQLKGRLFNTAVEVQSESQKVLYSLTANDFQARFQKCRKAGTGV
ncbi:uncharacterized protein LOC106883208 [Octopus bimaculoides]|uniref:uncharacterized protein LOC106883208 n=1 Tax=Octopus bimaculoides TaxID=37653 RepID=UPI00071D1D11|nr:uncharacterized protein LOC106883208 [Octopus bimaculoides]|eukprot:XP_014789617.1 PREDICTED: uncharacterized protein LOC106883208 [Octopus bimaculoides]